MKLNLNYNLMPYWLLYIIFLLVSVVYVYHNELNCDVGWFLYSADRLLNGAILYQDIIEINTPLIYYFYVIPVWIAKALNISPILSLYIYLFAITIYAIYLSWVLLNNLSYLSSNTIHAILVVFAFLIWVYPTGNHGQREHMVIVMGMPYFLAVANRAFNRPMSNSITVQVGIYSGIGFMLKPHFLLIFLLLEGYLAVISLKKNHKIKLIKPEFIIISLIAAVYYGFLYINHDYSKVLALAWETYFAFNCNYMDILTIPDVLLWLFSCLLLLCYIRNKRHLFKDYIIITIFLVSLGFFLIGFLQKKGYPYHFYPVGILSIIIITYIIINCIELNYNAKYNIILIIIFFLGLSTIGVWKCLRHYVRYKNGEIPKIIAIINQHSENKSIYIFSCSVRPAFPVVNHSKSFWPVRFHHLWPLPAMYYQYLDHQEEFQYHAPDQMRKI